jgi:hypothetical protein
MWDISKVNLLGRNYSSYITIINTIRNKAFLYRRFYVRNQLLPINAKLQQENTVTTVIIIINIIGLKVIN